MDGAETEGSPNQLTGWKYQNFLGNNMSQCKCGSHWVMVCPHCHEYTQMWQWISVKKKLPEEFKRVLVCVSLGKNSEYAVGTGCMEKKDWYEEPLEIPNRRFPKGKIKYWMELPPPIKKQDEVD